MYIPNLVSSNSLGVKERKLKSPTSPSLVIGLHLHQWPEVELLGEDVGLRAGVGDETGGAELLSSSHCVFGR